MSLYEDMPMIQGGGGIIVSKMLDYILELTVYLSKRSKYKVQNIILNNQFFSITNGNLIHVP